MNEDAKMTETAQVMEELRKSVEETQISFTELKKRLEIILHPAPPTCVEEKLKTSQYQTKLACSLSEIKDKIQNLASQIRDTQNRLEL